jgi:hypothetical protein
MRRAVVLVAVAALAATYGSRAEAASPADGGGVTSSQWLAVINDWLDDTRIERRHSCGAVVVAVARLSAYRGQSTRGPGPPDRQAISVLDRYAASVCPRHGRPDEITVGMTDREVASLAGMPRTPGVKCWLYPVTRALDGRRVCFTNSRVSSVQVSEHL